MRMHLQSILNSKHVFQHSISTRPQNTHIPRVGTLSVRSSSEDQPVVVGIDLGTTNSAVAIIEGGEPVAIPNQDGELTTPSVVSFRADGTVLVGAAARRQAAADPSNTFYSVKRFIGSTPEASQEDINRVSYSITSDEDGLVVIECANVEGGRLYPEEVSGYVVAHLLAAAEEYSGRNISKAVISVPAYFDDEQREATATAGRLAGLETVKILREPVAAALAYGLSVEDDKTVLVFDLGGGTFDVSLLEVGGGVIEVLSTGGDPHLGGDDWDAALVDWLIKEHLKPKGVNCEDPRIVANLKAIAETAKIKLSSEEKVVIRMPIAGGIEVPITQQLLESLTIDLFRRARLPLDQACWQAGVDLGTAVKEYDDAVRASKKRGKNKSRAGGSAASTSALEGVQIRPKKRAPVSEVLLVGGATRMPAVQRFVKNMTGIEPKEFKVDPDLAVALGAAVQAGIYEGQISNLMVMDVWQASLMRAFATKVYEEQNSEEQEDEEESKNTREIDDDEEDTFLGEEIDTAE